MLFHHITLVSLEDQHLQGPSHLSLGLGHRWCPGGQVNQLQGPQAILGLSPEPHHGPSSGKASGGGSCMSMFSGDRPDTWRELSLSSWWYKDHRGI